MPHFFEKKKKKMVGFFIFLLLTFIFSRDVSVTCFILKGQGSPRREHRSRACLASSVTVDHLRFSSVF